MASVTGPVKQGHSLGYRRCIHIMDKCTELVILTSFPFYETKMPDCRLAAIK